MSDWTQRAACRGMGTALFFPGRGESPRAALAVCARCMVLDECLQSAIDNDDQGVRGGMTEEQREEYVRQQQRRGTAS